MGTFKRGNGRGACKPCPGNDKPGQSRCRKAKQAQGSAGAESVRPTAPLAGGWCLRGTVCTRSIAQTDLEEVAHQLQSQEHTVRLLNRAVPMKTSARMQPSDHTSMR